jgi:hypothetical protein
VKIFLALLTIASLLVAAPAQARACGEPYKVGYGETTSAGAVRQRLVVRDCGGRVDVLRLRLHSRQDAPMQGAWHAVTLKAGDRERTVWRFTSPGRSTVVVDLTRLPSWPAGATWNGLYQWYNVNGLPVEGGGQGGDL